MGGVAKAFKKVVKGVGKVVKKVVKSVAKVGKKIFSAVGKVMGKLGPIGSIAIGFIAPYALGAMASSSIGWVSTIGKGIQAVKAAVAAPFKMAGQALGKGVSALGQAVGSKGGMFQTVTGKISNFLGYKGGSLADGMSAIKDSVAGQWNDAFGTNFATSGAKGPLDLGVVQASGAKGPMGPEIGTEQWNPNQGNVDLLGGPDAKTFVPSDAVNFDGTKAPKLFGDMGPKSVFDPSQADPFTTMEDLKGIDVTKPTPDAQYRLEEKTGLKMPKMPKGLFGGPRSPTSLTPMDASGYALQSAQSGKGPGGEGSMGTSFHAQQQTGLLMTEDLVRQQRSLLGRMG